MISAIASRLSQHDQATDHTSDDRPAVIRARHYRIFEWSEPAGHEAFLYSWEKPPPGVYLKNIIKLGSYDNPSKAPDISGTEHACVPRNTVVIVEIIEFFAIL